MSDMDPIAAARALIEPLTGYTSGPWEANINDQYGSIMVPLSGWDGDFKPADARLIAAAPDLRDMVAALADALEAERAKVAAARLAGWRAGQDDAAEIAVDRYEAWSDDDSCPVVCDVTACADVAAAALPGTEGG